LTLACSSSPPKIHGPVSVASIVCVTSTMIVFVMNMVAVVEIVSEAYDLLEPKIFSLLWLHTTAIIIEVA